jgi:hypothetical protein
VLQHRDLLSTAWLLEVNLRHVAGDGSYGVLLQSDAGTTTRVTITPDLRLGIWSSESPAEPLIAMSLPNNVVAKAWHQLIISYSGSLLRVQFDYLRELEVVVKDVARSFALLTEYCSSAFSGISLTDHFRDEFLNDERTPALLGWNIESRNESVVGNTALSDWHVQDGKLEQTSAMQGQHILLKAPFHEQYESGATMMLRRANQDGQAALGLVIQHSRDDSLLVWLLQDRLRWKLVAERLARNVRTVSKTLDLPESFDPFAWHTLRLRRGNDQLTVYLDGPEVLTVNVPTRSERVGLITRDAAAAFMDVWQTGWPAK